MSLSLESRLPFLDHKLVEFVLSLPARFFMKEGQNKWMLRRAIENFVPRSVIDNKKKFGFPIPDWTWQRGPLRESISDLVNSDSLASRGVFDAGAVQRLWNKLLLETNDWASSRELTLRIFRIVSTELWLRGLEAFPERIRQLDTHVDPSQVCWGD
jgi:asparagine synthase (glutamine-hydrolysing)